MKLNYCLRALLYFMVTSLVSFLLFYKKMGLWCFILPLVPIFVVFIISFIFVYTAQEVNDGDL